jgi:hypothetical protein
MALFSKSVFYGGDILHILVGVKAFKGTTPSWLKSVALKSQSSASRTGFPIWNCRMLISPEMAI